MVDIRKFIGWTLAAFCIGLLAIVLILLVAFIVCNPAAMVGVLVSCALIGTPLLAHYLITGRLP